MVLAGRKLEKHLNDRLARVLSAYHCTWHAHVEYVRRTIDGSKEGKKKKKKKGSSII